MMRSLFYTGRHRPTTTDGQPVTYTEVAARLRREARLAAMMPTELFGLPAEYVYSCFGVSPEQLGAMSV